MSANQAKEKQVIHNIRKVSRSKPVLHLIYSGNPENDSSVRAPETIANHLFRHLSKRFKVNYMDWLYKGPVDVGPDDVILGHPYYDESTVVQNLFLHAQCRAKCLIFPFHHALPKINMPFDPLVRQCDRLFSITGEYWHLTLLNTVFSYWATKMVRLDMAVDNRRFPYLKTTFNPPGKRVLFYIGSDLPEKGVNHLAELVKQTQCRLIYAGSLNQSKKLFEGLDFEYWGPINLTHDRLSQIAKQCDFFVNTSVSDANPTTILEMASLGLPVLCSPQSGYIRSDLVYTLNLNDPVQNIATINALQQASEETLLTRSREARKIIEKEYTWNRFCTSVENELAAFL